MGCFFWEIAANPDEWPEGWEGTEITGRQYHDDPDEWPGDWGNTETAGRQYYDDPDVDIEISYQEILSYDDDLPNPFDDD